MTKKEVKNENIKNEVKEEKTIDVQEETLEEEAVEESKFKKAINWIKDHKTEIAIGAAVIVGGAIGYVLNESKEDTLTTAISGSDTLSIEMDPEEPVDVEVTSEDQVSEEA